MAESLFEFMTRLPARLAADCILHAIIQKSIIGENAILDDCKHIFFSETRGPNSVNSNFDRKYTHLQIQNKGGQIML